MKLFLKNLLFSLLIPGSVAVYIPLIITRARGITTYLLCLVIGFLLMALGVIIYTWTVWDFASFGKGTPLPIDAPKKLVVRGLYCYSRNPMYLGVMMVILGWAGVLANSWLFVYAFVVGIVVHLFVVGYEEPKLKELFGEEYETYRAAVNRWIPSIR